MAYQHGNGGRLSRELSARLAYPLLDQARAVRDLAAAVAPDDGPVVSEAKARLKLAELRGELEWLLREIAALDRRMRK